VGVSSRRDPRQVHLFDMSTRYDRRLVVSEHIYGQTVEPLRDETQSAHLARLLHQEISYRQDESTQATHIVIQQPRSHVAVSGNAVGSYGL
jgi:hypothetical protein